MRSNFQQIVSYCLGLRTQNPGLREVDLEPSPERGSDKINMQKQGRITQNKASRIIQSGLTYGFQHLERQTWNPVLRDEPIGPELQLAFTDRLEACILNSRPTKSHTNQPRLKVIRTFRHILQFFTFFPFHLLIHLKLTFHFSIINITVPSRERLA